MMKSIAALLVLSISPLLGDDRPTECPVCHGGLVRITKLKDDPTKPSTNMAVWNRSNCGLQFFNASSQMCVKDHYAWDTAEGEKWVLTLEDRDGFKLPLEKSIHDLPLRKDDGAVYSETFRTTREIDYSVWMWTAIDEDYFKKLRKYCESNKLHLSIESRDDRHEAFVRVSLTGKTGQVDGASATVR